MEKRSSLIPMSNLLFRGNEEKYVLEAIRSTWVSSLGKYIDQFEDNFASFIGVRHAVSVANGTCALHLALKVLDIGPGDEVIVPAFTFPATVNVVFHSGATPVLVDCLPDHWNMDPAEFAKAVSSATRAVIPVHLYGHPCDMGPILEIARQHKIFVIEDAAEAHGSECLGKKAGSLGDIGCFSFYGNKVITTGEGGMCVTEDDRLNDRLRIMRDHGMSKNKRYWQEEIGFNFRLTNLNAALGVAQLEQIEEILARRAELTRVYEEGVKGISGLRIYPDSPFGKKIDWLFCLFVEDKFPLGRDLLVQKLKEYNIDSRPTFYPIHLMPPYNAVDKVGDLVNSEKFGLTGINLPLYPSLTKEDIQYVVEVLKTVANNNYL